MARPDPTTLRDALRALSPMLSHAEAFRRIRAAGHRASLQTVARLRREALGPRRAGRPRGADSALLESLRSIAERHNLSPDEALQTLDRLLSIAR